MKAKFFTAALLCAAFSFLFSSCASFAQISYNQTEISDPALVKADSGVLAVHFLDVGQGDSEFVELPNGDTMLIDAGETDKGITVVSDIKEMEYSEINYIVATHPHSDHIGGFTEVLAEFDVDNIYLPDAVSSSDIYSEFLKSAEAEDCNVLKAESGVEIINENNLTAEFLAPVSSEYDELNNYSAVLKITYENNSFIFMGDAEALSEKEITADVSADVIKVGHHGSNTSSCENFVNRVSAEYAVIECGAGNSYGHPNEDVVSRWENSGALVMTTMDCGNILISSNGSEINALCTNENEIQSSVSQNAAQSAENEWVINVKTKKVHTADCPYAGKIAAENKEYSDKPVSELIAQGYSKCGSCNPGD